MSSSKATPVPADLIGIWRRESILLIGVEGIPEVPRETADVIWFQARSRYADLRLPRAPGAGPLSAAEAFGGGQTWRAPRLHFHHELDRSGGFGDDQGVLSWDGATLLERGEFVSAGVVCRYTERWVRTTPYLTRAQVWERRGAADALTGLALRIAEQELVLTLTDGEVCAAYRRRSPDGLKVLARLGSSPAVAGELSADWRCIEDDGRQR